jgi:hypothetical protein
MSIATLRASLATQLANDGVWSVFSYPPASPIANSVIVWPDDPYIQPTNNNYAGQILPRVNFKITLIVPLFSNEGNLNGIEDYIVALFNKVSAWSVPCDVGDFSAPSVLPTDAGQMLASEFTISILGSWE